MGNLAVIKNLNKLASELDCFFASHPQANADLAQWLSDNFHPLQLIALLQNILTDQQLLKDVSTRSYQHGNGFLKVVLLDRGYKLRLHVWFKGQSCEENIHDHRWSFASHILTGTLKSEIWTDVSHDIPNIFNAKEFEYVAADQQHAAYKIDKGMCHLQHVETLYHHAGQSYVMPEQRLHRIINHGQKMVATIMCTAPTEQGTTRLIPTYGDIDPNIQPPKINAASLHQQLHRFMRLYRQEL